MPPKTGPRPRRGPRVTARKSVPPSNPAPDDSVHPPAPTAATAATSATTISTTAPASESETTVPSLTSSAEANSFETPTAPEATPQSGTGTENENETIIVPQLVEPSPEVNEESDAPPLTSPPPAKKTVRVVKKKVVRKMVTRRVEKGLVGSSTTQSEAKPSPNSDPAVSAAMEGVVVSGLAEEVENPKPPLDGVVISGLDHEIEKPSPPISVTMEGVAVLGSADEVEKPNPNPKILSKAAAVIPTEGLVSTLVEDTIENPRISAMEDGEMKEEVENCDGGGTKEVAEVEDSMAVLSEEMEALERQKRRKTEIFIGGLDKSAREEDIRKVFEEVGEVLEVRLMMNSKTGKNKGYAFLRFALASDAKRALAKYPKIEFITVSPSWRTCSLIFQPWQGPRQCMPLIALYP
ncbi:hypothetical protein CK203_100007 [Vitis vinifera]|uniref:RRM domain-containing protein n=1 Tax=Vitis vinifera TaxID=29760 RepID=A0A438DI88_VITVI|nr:hypothetical protein CK203_100007 [Vitis vinifera]